MLMSMLLLMRLWKTIWMIFSILFFTLSFLKQSIIFSAKTTCYSEVFRTSIKDKCSWLRMWTTNINFPSKFSIFKYINQRNLNHILCFEHRLTVFLALIEIDNLIFLIYLFLLNKWIWSICLFMELKPLIRHQQSCSLFFNGIILKSSELCIVH